MLTKTKNAFEAKFNGQTDLLRDEDGYLYIFGVEKELYKGLKTETVELEELRKTGTKLALQPYWDKEDWEGFQKAWDEIKASTIQKVDVIALKRSIDERKSKLDNPAAFRTTEADQTDIYNLHLQTGWKADRIASEIGLGLPTVVKILKKKKEEADNSKS